MDRERAKQLQKDYCPTGVYVSVNDLVFRRTLRSEVFRCGRQVAYDTQSGEIYCGDVADFVSITATGVAALCGRHRPPNVTGDLHE